MQSVRKSDQNTEFSLYSLLGDSSQMMLPMWPQAVRDVQMARLLHLIKHRELKLKTASLVLKVTVISYKKITDCN